MEGAESESREAAAEKLIGFLKRTDAPAFFQRILHGGEYIPSFEEFKDFVIRMNGIVRKIPIANREIAREEVEMRGDGGVIRFPKFEDKEPLLRYAYDAGTNIRPEDAKYLLPAVINAVHLFDDGNGRTSRTLHLLLREFPTEDERMRASEEALGESGRFDTFDINPAKISGDIRHIVLMRHGWNFDSDGLPLQLGPIASPPATNEYNQLDDGDEKQKRAKDFFRLYADDAAYGLTAMYQHLGYERLHEVSREYPRGNLISPLMMAEILTDEDWNAIFENFYRLKKEHVEVLVDIFSHPDEYRTEDGTETIRDHFIRRIESR